MHGRCGGVERGRGKKKKKKIVTILTLEEIASKLHWPTLGRPFHKIHILVYSIYKRGQIFTRVIE